MIRQFERLDVLLRNTHQNRGHNQELLIRSQFEFIATYPKTINSFSMSSSILRRFLRPRKSSQKVSRPEPAFKGQTDGWRLGVTRNVAGVEANIDIDDRCTNVITVIHPP